MSRETIILTHGVSARRLIQRLMGLTFEKPWKITIEQVTGRARTSQEAVLRGKERIIADYTGHDPDEVHEQMLARHYGTIDVDLGNGRTWSRPARRTRTGDNPLSPAEMSQHIMFVEAFGATELGLVMR